jgi:hypothetical protein
MQTDSSGVCENPNTSDAGPEWPAKIVVELAKTETVLLVGRMSLQESGS